MTTIWLTAVSTMFFCESRGVAQLMLRCMRSVQSGHADQQDDARGEHLPEIAVRGGIVEEEDPRHGRRGDFAHRIRKGEIQPPHDEDDRQDEARHETEGLERIGPDQRLDTPLLRIEPDEGHRTQRIEPERQPVTVENEQLQHGTDDIDPQRGAENFRDEEEPCAGAVRGDAGLTSRYS